MQHSKLLHFVLCTAFVGSGCSDDSSSTDEATGSNSSTLTATGLSDGSTSSGGLTDTSMHGTSVNEGTTAPSSRESESSGSSSADGEGSSAAEASSHGDNPTGSSGDESSSAAGTNHSDATSDGDTSSESGGVGGSTSTTQDESGGETEDAEDPIDVPNLDYILDPYRRTPLAAIVPVRPEEVGLNEITEATITVRGDGPGARDFTATIDPRTPEFQANFGAPDLLEEGQIGIPIMGLYPALENHVELRLRDGTTVVRSELVIPTSSVPEQSETVIVHVADADMRDNFAWVRHRLYDDRGRIRWTGPSAFSFMRNGNMLDWGFREVNWIGRFVAGWSVADLQFHHDIVELPNGNVLVCAATTDRTIIKDGVEYTSNQDYIVELDRDSNIQNIWDLREYLDVSRGTVADRSGNWIHMNTLIYDEYDDSIIVSGRHQGIFKITRRGIHGTAVNEGKELVWILAPHLDWGLAGWDGTGPLDPNEYLLTAVDHENVPFNEGVQDNIVPLAASDDLFHWPVGQHGLQITSRGDGRISFLTFNNQASYVFDGPGSVMNGVAGLQHGDLSNDRSPVSYSMLNEYEVDEVDMTVRQIWGFGAGRQELYSSYMSGVIWNEANDHRFMMANGEDLLTPNQLVHNPHLVEVTPEHEVVFHLEIQNTDMSAYRGKRLDPYRPARPLAH